MWIFLQLHQRSILMETKKRGKYKKSAKQKEKESLRRKQKRYERKLEKARHDRKLARTRREYNKRRREKRRKAKFERLKAQRAEERKLNKPKKRYKLIYARNKKQAGVFGTYYTLKDCYAALEKQVEKHKSVVFPKKLNNSRAITPFIGEYLVLEKNDTNPEEEATSVLRNKYGKMVTYKSGSKEWRIIDKREVEEEEDFWVYGYDSMKERKTYQWIVDNLLLKDLTADKEQYKRVQLFQNKLVILSDDDHLDMVICKAKSDGIRLYNKIEEEHFKRVLMLGFIGGQGNLKVRELMDKICAATGWSRMKVKRLSNRH